MSLVLPHRDDEGRVDSVQVWRFGDVPPCQVCDGSGWRRVPRNMRLDAKPFALVDLELRECATCSGTGDASAREAQGAGSRNVGREGGEESTALRTEHDAEVAGRAGGSDGRRHGQVLLADAALDDAHVQPEPASCHEPAGVGSTPAMPVPVEVGMVP